MKVELQLAEAELSRSEDLRVEARITNASDAPARLYLRPLVAPSLVLEVRDAQGGPVPKGPPPTPVVDDGESHRQILEPGQSLEQVYRGSQLFGWSLDPGTYEVRFRYRAPEVEGDWSGELQSDWEAFTVAP